MFAIAGYRCFHGPNMWSRSPVTLLVVRLQSRDRHPDPDVNLLFERAMAAMAGIDDPTLSADPIEPLPYTVGGLPGLAGVLAVNLQRRAGESVSFTATRAIGGELHEIALEHRQSDVGLAAARLSLRWIADLCGDEIDFALGPEFVSHVSGLAAAWRQSAAGERVLAVAQARGIPVSKIDPTGRIIELGTGIHRTRFHGSVTSRTPKLGDAIQLNKDLTCAYLRAAGLPVPEGRGVRTADQAVTVAEELGYPVVIKPNDHGAGAGVRVNLTNESEIREHFEAASQASPTRTVRVERHISGIEYRVSVVNGTVCAINEHRPAEVLGNGVDSIRVLIDHENAAPNRGWPDRFPLKPIPLDDATLAEIALQGHSLESIPAAGIRIRLRDVGKIIKGGLSVDRTDDGHPENVAIFLQAARAVDLDVCAMDVIATDISQSMVETGGAILEINAGSAMRNELIPAIGDPRDPGPGIVGLLYPEGTPVRVPVVAVMGEDPGRLCELLGECAARAGFVAGVATAGAVTVGGRPLRRDIEKGPSGARIVLDNPMTEIAIIGVSARGLMEHGLGFDVCDVVVLDSASGLVTPFGEPVERVLTRLLTPDGLLLVDAGDPELPEIVAGDHRVQRYDADPVHAVRARLNSRGYFG